LGTEWQPWTARLDLESRRSSEELAQVQREQQPLADRGALEVFPDQLLKPLQAIEDGVPVQPQGGGGLLDRPPGEHGLERLQERATGVVRDQAAQDVLPVPLRDDGDL